MKNKTKFYMALAIIIGAGTIGLIATSGQFFQGAAVDKILLPQQCKLFQEECAKGKRNFCESFDNMCRKPLTSTPPKPIAQPPVPTCSSPAELRCVLPVVQPRYVNRVELVRMLVDARGWPLVNPATPTFSDVPANSWMYPYVETAYAHGLVQGYPDGTFRPTDSINRAQFAIVVARAFELSGVGPFVQGVPAFTDVPDTSWYSQGVYSLYQIGAMRVEYRPFNLVEQSFAEEVIRNMPTT